MDDTVFGEVGQTEVGDVTPVASPAEETPATTPEQSSPQETNVPFNQHPRCKEVYEKSRKVDTLEQQLQQLQQQMSQGKQGEQNWQPKTWEEVLQKAAELGEQRVFERAVVDLNRHPDEAVIARRFVDLERRFFKADAAGKKSFVGVPQKSRLGKIEKLVVLDDFGREGDGRARTRQGSAPEISRIEIVGLPGNYDRI